LSKTELAYSYSDDYKEKCFQTWYASGRPTSAARTLDILPEDEFGRKPVRSLVEVWRKDLMWDARADDLDSKAIAIAEDALIMQKAEMLKRQAERAGKLAEKAFDELVTEGFDSSAAAVNAYFRATEEERMTRGISDMIVKMSKMNDADLADTVLDLLRRANENDQIIDSAPVDVDTESKEEDKNDKK
jgi:hypothetical protein